MPDSVGEIPNKARQTELEVVSGIFSEIFLKIRYLSFFSNWHSTS